jgi:hypothetical protein
MLGAAYARDGLVRAANDARRIVIRIRIATTARRVQPSLE